MSGIFALGIGFFLPSKCQFRDIDHLIGFMFKDRIFPVSNNVYNEFHSRKVPLVVFDVKSDGCKYISNGTFGRAR